MQIHKDTPFEMLLSVQRNQDSMERELTDYRDDAETSKMNPDYFILSKATIQKS